jgi:prepilin-type N-terminal cleavage/methylation domain-containing protein
MSLYIILKLRMDSRKGFTLIELLLAVAVASVLFVLVVQTIDPVSRMKQARDSQRRTEINGLANALRSYEAVYGKYPDEAANSETSRGTSTADWTCGTGSSWNTASSIYTGLVTTGGLLKRLPTDPKNSSTNCYIYEPKGPAESPCTTASRTCQYYIGTLLEKPQDSGKPVFRCTDYTSLTAGGGCKEVAALGN